MRTTEAFAKINLGLVVGPLRTDGKHEVVTVLQRIGLSDTIELEAAGSEDGIVVDGFEDTIVHFALAAFHDATGVDHGWRVRLEKRIPVAAGLGGGSADAAAALRLANEISGSPLTDGHLHEIGARVGADVPFFLRSGAQLATGAGSELAPAPILDDVPAVLVLPHSEGKQSTAAVYAEFAGRAGELGFEERRNAMLSAVQRVAAAVDFAWLPGNDLASSAVSEDMRRLGAFRAEVSGAGPAVYGLFADKDVARDAELALRAKGKTWLTKTVSGR